MIPLCRPYLDEKELEAVKEVFESGWLAEGPKNEELEKMFADYIGVKRAVTSNSCASALFLVVKALDIKGEVILPSFTFAASANAVETAGATPVFVDIDYNTCNIDVIKTEEKITPKTEAIMPVHFAGQSSKMDEIMNLAERYNLKVIEDSAEAVGAEFDGKKTGSFGIGCFSFFPTKNMTTGEGGMITTNDETLAEKIKTMASHGIPKSTLGREKDKKPWARSAIYAGYNFRMSNILAAIGVEQFKKLETMNELRREHAKYLNEGLKGVKQIDLPIEMAGCKHVYQMYTIKLKTGNRDEFVLKLREAGIGASVHFDPPVHLQHYYQNKYNYKTGDFPITEKVSESIVTLPMYPALTQKDLDFIIDTIKKIVK